MEQASDAGDATTITPAENEDSGELDYCDDCGLRTDGRHGCCACSTTSDNEPHVQPTVDDNHNEDQMSDARYEADDDYVYDNESYSDDEMKR